MERYVEATLGIEQSILQFHWREREWIFGWRCFDFVLENNFLNQMLLFPLTLKMTGTSLKVLKVAPKWK